MVRLYMKEEFVSKQNKVIVKSQTGENMFLAVGTWGRTGDLISLYTMEGSLLVKVKQVNLSLLPKFDLYVRGKKVGTITKHMAFSKPYFKISKLDWKVTGDFEQTNYQIRHRNNPIAQIEKNCLWRGDFYVLDIQEPHHAPVCVVIALIVDHYARKRQGELSPERQKELAEIRLI